MKLAVIVDSKTGNTRQAADWIVQGMNQVEDTEAKAFTIPEVDETFVKEAQGIVVGSPSYAAQMTNDNENAVYACLNYSEACCPRQIEGHSIVIDGDSGEVIKRLM